MQLQSLLATSSVMPPLRGACIPPLPETMSARKALPCKWISSISMLCTPKHSRRSLRQPRASAAKAAASSSQQQQQEANDLDRYLAMKISLASSTDKLDLSECNLASLPPQVLELTDLEVCTTPAPMHHGLTLTFSCGWQPHTLPTSDVIPRYICAFCRKLCPCSSLSQPALELPLGTGVPLDKDGCDAGCQRNKRLSRCCA